MMLFPRGSCASGVREGQEGEKEQEGKERQEGALHARLKCPCLMLLPLHSCRFATGTGLRRCSGLAPGVRGVVTIRAVVPQKKDKKRKKEKKSKKKEKKGKKSSRDD